MSAVSPCAHEHLIGREVVPQAEGCRDCVALGDAWVHLRVCLSCGYVGCCDSSKNQHALAHFRATEHPIVASHQPGEHWRWCYVDETFLLGE